MWVCMWTLNSFSSHDRTLFFPLGCVWVEIEREKNANPFNMVLNATRIEFGLVETIDDAIKQIPFICFKASIRFCNQHTFFPLKKCHDMKKAVSSVCPFAQQFFSRLFVRVGLIRWKDSSISLAPRLTRIGYGRTRIEKSTTKIGTVKRHKLLASAT